jgi:hypothetical protein
MRRQALSYDVFLTALTFAAATSATACSKSEAPKASAEPAAEARSAASPAASAPPPPPTPAVAATATSGEARKDKGETNAPVIDAGKEVAPSPKPVKNAAPGQGGSATCGATTCSADMKKGN